MQSVFDVYQTHGLPVETSSFTSFDGTRIVYDKLGSGALPVVLANGLGGDTEAWWPLAQTLERRCQFYCPDHRGMFRSGPAPSDNDYTITHHARDLEALLRHEGIEQAAVIGWSMGSAVALELFRLHPNRPLAMVFLNGAHRVPLGNLFPQRGRGRQWLGAAAHQLAPIAERANRLGARIVDRPGAVPWLNLLGIVDRSIDQGTAASVLRRFVRSNAEIIWHTTLGILNYDGTRLLPQNHVPSLVLTGERDKLVPLSTARMLAANLHDARFVAIPRATHYALLEFPDIVSLHIESFLEEQNLLPNI